MERPFTRVWLICIMILVIAFVYVFAGAIRKPVPQIPAFAKNVTTPTLPPLPTPTPKETPLALPDLFPDLKWGKVTPASGSGFMLQTPNGKINLEGDYWTAESVENTSGNSTVFINKFDSYYSTFTNLTHWSEFRLVIGNTEYSAVYPKSVNGFTKGYIKKYKNQLQVIYISLSQEPTKSCPCTLNFEVFISNPLSVASLETPPAP